MNSAATAPNRPTEHRQQRGDRDRRALVEADQEEIGEDHGEREDEAGLAGSPPSPAAPCRSIRSRSRRAGCVLASFSMAAIASPEE